MSSSVVVLETKAARVSLAPPVQSRTRTLETPATQAKRGSFFNCPQPRSIFSLYVLFCLCRPCDVAPENYFFQMPKLVILSVVSGMILFRREAFSTKEARYFEKNEKVYINKLIY